MRNYMSIGECSEDEEEERFRPVIKHIYADVIAYRDYVITYIYNNERLAC